MEKKRERRRRDLLRMKARSRRIYSVFDRPGDDPKRHEKLANHIKACSGWCCGNPRRWFGELTRQERRFRAEGIECFPTSIARNGD